MPKETLKLPPGTILSVIPAICGNTNLITIGFIRMVTVGSLIISKTPILWIPLE